MRGRSIGVDVEIVEATKYLTEVRESGVTVPNRLRLNGMEILWPKDHPPVVAPIDLSGTAAMVTVTMFARSVRITAEPDPLPDAGTPLYDRLEDEHRATFAAEPQFTTPSFHDTEVEWFIANRKQIEARQQAAYERDR